MEVILYIASTIDGYIASKDGSVDFLSVVEDNSEDYGFNEFYKNIDAVIMGRKTFDFCRNVESWPYAGKKSYVFTKSDLKTERDDIEFISGDVKDNFKTITAAGLRKIWLVGGGILNSEFLNNNLIDKIVLSIIPVILGDGIKLFPSAKLRSMQLTDFKRYKTGLIQLTYSVK